MQRKTTRMVLGNVALLTLTILLITGCSRGDDAAKTDSPSIDPALQSATATPAATDLKAGERNAPGMARAASLPTHVDPAPSARQVIRHAELDVRVDNVEKAEKAVGAIVQAAGGYTETASSTDLASTQPQLTISLRVPVATFDQSISKFEALGVRLSKKIGSEDVTGQLVDMDARLRTLKAQEDVYRGMLKNRTQLDEVFSIQSQLTQVRTQIETISGERKTQAGLAAMSTIALTLEQNAVMNQPTTDPNWVAQTWGEASSGASVAFRIFVVALVWILAFSPFWIPLLLILRKVLKSQTHKKSPPASVQY